MRGLRRLLAITATTLGIACSQVCAAAPALSTESRVETVPTSWRFSAQPDAFSSTDHRRDKAFATSWSPSQKADLSSASTAQVKTPDRPKPRYEWASGGAWESFQASQVGTPAAIRNEVQQDISASWTLQGETGAKGIGFEISPRTSHISTSTFKSTRAGAEVRIGQDLDLRGKDVRMPSWYVFASADGEAIVWDVATSGLNFTNGSMTLQDRVTVGDIQAGIAFEQAGGQFAISYVKREFNYRNESLSQSVDGEFAALTFTFRR